MSGDKGKKAVQEPTWDVGLPDNIEFEVHLLDWLFALEGADGVSEPERTPVHRGPHSFREDRCWHTTFRCLSLKAHGTKEAGNQRAAKQGTRSSPVQSLVVSILRFVLLLEITSSTILQHYYSSSSLLSPTELCFPLTDLSL